MVTIGYVYTITSALWIGIGLFRGLFLYASISAPLTQRVRKGNSSTHLETSTNPSVYGQTVTFTANVTAAGAPVTDGTTTFKDGLRILGTANVNSGVATLTSSGLTAGSHSITAVYNGNGNFKSSNDSLLQVVRKANTKTVVTSSKNPSTSGQQVVFTAEVDAVAPGAGTPSGTVTFKDGNISLGTRNLNSSGIATLVISSLSRGSHSITVVYNGGDSFNNSLSPSLSQVVQR